MRAILVDAGGVLFNNVTESSAFFDVLAEIHDVEVGSLLRNVERRDADYETNACSVHSVLADCLREAGSTYPYRAHEVDQLYVNSVVAYAPVFVALRRLRARSDVVLALANNEAERWDRLKDEAFAHLSLFDVVGSSWRLGYVKPSADYFAQLLAECACGPAEAVLVDDNPEVVAAARDFGLHAVLVSDASGASRVLSDL